MSILSSKLASKKLFFSLECFALKPNNKVDWFFNFVDLLFRCLSDYDGIRHGAPLYDGFHLKSVK